MADFRLLGPLEVVAGGTSLPLGGPQQRAVLALLVLRANRVVTTDSLVDSLWGADSPGSAVGVVHTYVSRLRQLLSRIDGARLVSRSPGYVFEADPLSIDAERFERQVETGRAHVAAGRPDLAATTFRQALALWRGDALADLPQLASVRPARAHLERMRQATVEDRVAADLALGRHAGIVDELEALTEQHPFRERLWGLLMTALYRSGRQAEALAAYQRVRTTLVDQVGIEPGPELQALERKILRQDTVLRWRPPGLVPPAPAPAPAPADPVTAQPLPLPPVIAHPAHLQPLVGRDRERARLEEALGAAATGHFAAVVVAGPPGIGKSALAARFAREAHARGSAVVLGRADEGFSPPFQPISEAIDHWARHAGARQLDALDPVVVRHLARIVPTLAERREEPPTPLPVGVDAERCLLFEAINRWIGHAARQPSEPSAPLVVVLEDLQWADPGTLLAVRHLLRTPPAAAALLLATHRDTEVVASPELTDLLATTRRHDHVHRIDLTGLADHEVVDLLHSGGNGRGSPGRAGRAFATELATKTGGNPLFIHETLRHLTERGAISPEAGRWAVDQPLEAFGVPAGIHEVIEQRLRRLPAATTGLLRRASVLGERFDLAVLSRVVDQPELRVVEAVEPALAAGLVEPQGVRAGAFSFSHALVREAILGGLALSDRVRTHWRAGQVLSELHAAHREPYLTDIAWHLAAGVQAGDPREAVAANIAAGRAAWGSLAFEDARDRFAAATELLEGSGLHDPELAYAAWFGLAEAASGTAELDRQRVGLVRAAAIARAERWAGRMALTATRYAAFAVAAGDSPSAGTLAQDQPPVEDIVEEAHDSLGDTSAANRSLLLSVEAIHAVASERYRLSRQRADAARDLASSLDDPTALALAQVARFWSRLGAPYQPDLGEIPERTLALRLPDDGLAPYRSFVLPLVPIPALQLGQRARFEALRGMLARSPERRRSLHVQAQLHMLDTTIALCAGRFDEAERLAMAQPGVPEWAIWESTARLHRALVAVERGQHAALRPYFEQALAAVPRLISPQAILAFLHAVGGDADAARRRIEILRPPGGVREVGWGRPLVLRYLAETAVELDDPDLAAELLPVLSEHSGQMLVSYTGSGFDGAADRGVGQLLLVLGRPSEAVARLTGAVAFEQAFGADAHATRSLYWLARAHQLRDDDGDRETARKLFQESATEAQRLGMDHLAAVAASRGAETDARRRTA